MHGVKPDYEVSGKNFNGLAWPFKKGLSGTSRSRQFWPTGMASVGAAGNTRLPWPVSNVQNVANHECDVLSSLMHPKGSWVDYVLIQISSTDDQPPQEIHK